MGNFPGYIRNLFVPKNHFNLFCTLVLVLGLMLLSPTLSAAQEKPSRKPPLPPATASGSSAKSIATASTINDSNINGALKRADEMMKKGDVDGPLKILLSVYEYSKSVLFTVKFFQGHYDKAINSPDTPQRDKEEIYVKLKRMDQLVPKYNSIYEVTTYNLGYLYAKKGDAEKARKYLTEVLELTPFSLKKDSISMRAKTLLLDVYGLEGEF